MHMHDFRVFDLLRLAGVFQLLSPTNAFSKFFRKFQVFLINYKSFENFKDYKFLMRLYRREKPQNPYICITKKCGVRTKGQVGFLLTKSPLYPLSRQ